MLLPSESLITHYSNHIFRTGTNSELSAPDTKSGTDIETCIVYLVFSIGTLVDRLSNPRNGPHLSVVGMTAELKIDTCRCRTVQMEGLMV